MDQSMMERNLMVNDTGWGNFFMWMEDITKASGFRDKCVDMVLCATHQEV